jgi:hypothetical protein
MGHFTQAQGLYLKAREEATNEEDQRRAVQGYSRASGAAGVQSGSLSLVEGLAMGARDEFPPDHPLVLEARARHAQVLKKTRGLSPYCQLLSAHLDDQLSRLGPEHPVVLSNQRELALGYSELGDLDRALTLQASAFHNARNTLPGGHPFVELLRRDIVVTLDRSGERDLAVDWLRNTVDDAGAVEAAVQHDALRTMEAQALELQRSCQLNEALAVRRKIVALQSTLFDPGHPARVSGLRDLAALLRVMGRSDEALDLEAEARVLGRATAEQQHSLVLAAVEAHARKDGSIAPPRVVLHASEQGPKGARVVTAEVEDAAGLLTVSLAIDGLPRVPTLGSEEWQLDQTGTRGTLQIPVPSSDDEGPTVISVAAENLLGVKSAFQSLVVP